MIKYLGSKRRLVPALAALARASGARTALDLFTGTTRVAQAFKAEGLHVTAVDSARYAEIFARCYVALDARTVDRRELDQALAYLDQLPGRPGYVTETFCHRARFFRPENGARIDAVRQALADEFQDHPLFPVLLTSLIEAADRVDSTTGVQMAFVKQWAPRALRPLQLRAPVLLEGEGRAVRGDAVALAPTLGSFDLAYLDPPYNQHRYDTNYHVWETLVAWDAPPHYGVACKRLDARDPATKSAFNARRRMPQALRATVAGVQADVLLLSYNDEAWLGVDELEDLCARYPCVTTLAFDSARYVGARIGIHNPAGEKVGRVSHLRNRELVVVAGPRAVVRRLARAGAAAGALSADRPAPPASMVR